MKVKIGNVIYNSSTHPIMIILTNDDKFNISCMINNDTKYAEFPEGWGDRDEMENWMDLSNETVIITA